MTDAEISQLIEEFHVPLHVRRHCAAVANFALMLAQKLAASGEKIDLTLVRQAAFIHDFVRVVDFQNLRPESFPDAVSKEDIACWKTLRKKYAGLHHAEAGARILEERGENELANVVRHHQFLQIKKGFNSWEEKIVYYADKRVKHDQVVSLKERLEDGRKRHAPELNDSEENREIDKKVFALEREIFTKIGEDL